jgi:hypothetical protein
MASSTSRAGRPSPLQNRVTPFGDIVAVAARGTMIGNRGVIHDAYRIVRPYQVRRWIACRLQYRGIRRTIMQPRRWTELFFLDEATAFAAGHRPCAECRNADYKRFKALWGTIGASPPDADAIDRVLHAERIERGRKVTALLRWHDLPDGTFVALGDEAWLVRADALLRWSPGGYDAVRARPRRGEARVITPPSIVAVFRAGYVPALHATAERAAADRVSAGASSCARR